MARREAGVVGVVAPLESGESEQTKKAHQAPQTGLVPQAEGKPGFDVVLSDAARAHPHPGVAGPS